MRGAVAAERDPVHPEHAHAFGHLASASGVRSTAVGEAANASGAGAVALGNQTTAAGANSIAIGNGATAMADNQIAIGSSDATYSLGGLNSAASTAAQSGEVGVVTTDRSGNLAADYSLSSGLAQNTGLIGRAREDIRENRGGIAAAMALDTPYVPSNKQFALSGGYGHYEDEGALAMAAAYRLNTTWQLNAGVASGIDSGGTGARVGFQAAW